MHESNIQIKLSYITGLRDVVVSELRKNSNFHIAQEGVDSIYLDFSTKILTAVKQLRSVARVYLTLQDEKYHPVHISNHKSILGNLIDIVINENTDKNTKSAQAFKTFKITCAGADSSEIRGIAKYVAGTYGILETEEADLKIHIIKLENIWEIGVQITVRPLSVRSYRVSNMSGAMDPTIAYAVNSFASLEKATSYLNIFSGSATLLIEAGQCYSNLDRLIGFDHDKKHLSLAVQNIKEAGLIKKIQLKEADIFDVPALGTFDAIATDLPFGMAIAKHENLQKLYQAFVSYSEKVLNPSGCLVIYTSEHEILKGVLHTSKFTIIKTLDLKFVTSVGAYLHPKIFVCEFK